MVKRTAIKSICMTLLFAGLSCTDLDTPVYDKLSDFWETPEQISAGAAVPYVGLRGLVEPFTIYGLQEACTDEVIVPTRGGDWYDFGLWERLWKHTWTPEHASVAGTWQFLYGNTEHSGIGPINLVLENLDKVDPDLAESIELPSLIAQMKTLRAYYYWLAMDLFGNIPVIENNNIRIEEIVTRPRAEVFSFIETQLLNSVADLPGEVNTFTYGRATKWLSQTLLAKLYLNAGVYTGTERWSDCIKACDAVLSSNQYVLEPNFFHNFAINNQDSRENIFVIPFEFEKGLNICLLHFFSLHYDSGDTYGLGRGGVNGFCSTSDYLSFFDENDIRRKMFLVGPQYRGSTQYADPVPNENSLQTDSETGLPLIFDSEVKTFSSNDPEFRLAGARCAKWEFNFWPPMSNDFAVFRLADVILMKAEAQLRSGDAAGALETINLRTDGVSIRSRAGLPDFNAEELTLENLLKERARELSWEGHRRNDMIRFGHFTDARNPEKLKSEDFRTLFPIPSSEINKNPNLVQNPGY
jgi:hypothetical protein